MTNPKTTGQAASNIAPDTQNEISDNDLDKVAGGEDKAKINIEKTLNIGSQSSGAGAGKITFNPF